MPISLLAHMIQQAKAGDLAVELFVQQFANGEIHDVRIQAPPSLLDNALIVVLYRVRKKGSLKMVPHSMTLDLESGAVKVKKIKV